MEIIDSAEPLELLLLKRPKVLIGVNSTALITSKLLDKDILSKSYFVGRMITIRFNILRITVWSVLV